MQSLHRLLLRRLKPGSKKLFFTCTACTSVPVRGRNPLRHGSDSTFRYMYMYAVEIPYGTVPEAVHEQISVHDRIPGVRRTPYGVDLRLWFFNSVKVLYYFEKKTGPCRAGFRPRTGTVRL